MMSLNWTNCGLLWGARAMPNGFGSLFADAPVKSSPMPLGLGIGIVCKRRDETGTGVGVKPVRLE